MRLTRLQDMKDKLGFVLLFLSSILVVYLSPRLGLPQMLVRLVFIGHVIVAFNSKDDVFWLTWFFVIINPPGRLFGSSAGDSVFRLPLYNLAPGVSLSFHEIFLFMYLIKYFLRRRESSSGYTPPFMLIMLYGAIVITYSWFIGMNAADAISAIRAYMPWFWVIVYISYIKDQTSLMRVFSMISPFVFVALALTLQAQITGEYLHTMLSGEVPTRVFADAAESLVRATHAMHLVFVSLFLAVYYSSHQRKMFSTTYLNLVTVASFVFIFLSATRGWMVASIILMSSYLFMGGYNFFRQITRVLVIMLAIFMLVSSIYPVLLFQASEALERFMTLESLVEGDLTAGGTLARISDRGPRVMAYFRQSPIIGWGFSSVFFNASDMHVGNQNLLMQGGIIGFAIWIMVFGAIAHGLIQLQRNSSRRNRVGSGAIVCLMAWLATFAIHSSSMQMLGFLHSQPATHIHWAFILVAAQALRNELHAPISAVVSSMNNK